VWERHAVFLSLRHSPTAEGDSYMLPDVVNVKCRALDSLLERMFHPCELWFETCSELHKAECSQFVFTDNSEFPVDISDLNYGTFRIRL
jgi:hypothetical protein